MQKQFLRYLCGASIAVGLTATASAQEGVDVFFSGLQIVAGGNAPAFTTFNPELNAPTSRMLNNGVAPDAATGPTDHVWTFQKTGLTPSGSPLAVATWKMGTWNGIAGAPNPGDGTTWQHESPSGGDGVYPTDAATVTFHWLDTGGSVGDGWLPDNNFVYTTPTNVQARLDAATGVYLWGNFGETVGIPAPGNWGDGATNALITATESAGVWSKSYAAGTFPAGSYQFKFVANAAWGDANEFGNNGEKGGNIAFTVVNAADALTFRLRESDGRYQINGLTQLPATPGFYVVGPFASPTAMTATGTGQEVELAVVGAAGNYTLNILEWSGSAVTRTFPSQGAHPFKTTTTNQTIRVSLRTTSMGDGATPDADFIYTDPASRHAWTGSGASVELVGCRSVWGTELHPTGDDWATGTAASYLTNTGDGLLFRINPSTTTAAVSRPYKCVATTPDRPSATGFAIQVGGEEVAAPVQQRNGLTLNGDNENPSFSFAATTDYEIFCDMAVGRVLVRVETSGTPNLRPANSELPVGSSSVSEWAQY